MESRDGILTIAATVALVVVVTVVQGLWTERWQEREDHVLQVAAERLERAFPESFGEWKIKATREVSPEELERAGAVGHISREYLNQKTKAVVSTFVVCAAPPDASGHTPDRSYPGAGFQIAEQEHRETIRLPDGRTIDAFTGTFAKEGQTLRIFWTYGVPVKSKPQDREASRATETEGERGTAEGAATDRREILDWVAPQVARIALNEYPSVYKMYAIIDQTKLPTSRATAECQDFITELVPVFEAALAAEAAREAAAPSTRPAAESPAAG